MTAYNIVESLNQKYAESYLGMRVLDRIIPIFIEEIKANEDCLEVKGQLWDSRLNYWQPINYDTPRSEDYFENRFLELPSYGLVNYNNFVVYLVKFPKRQFQRGMSNNTIQIMPSDNFAQRPDKDFSYEITGRLLDKAFNPIYPTVGEIIKKIRSGDWVASAFSNDYHLSKIDIDANKIGLFRARYLIGKVSDTNELMLLQNTKLFFEELTSYHKAVIYENNR